MTKNRTNERRRSTLGSPEKNKCLCGSDDWWKNKLPRRIWRYYCVLFKFYLQSVKIDSPVAVMSLQIKEIIEIILQTTVFYYYGGSQASFIKWINLGSTSSRDFGFSLKSLGEE